MTIRYTGILGYDLMSIKFWQICFFDNKEPPSLFGDIPDRLRSLQGMVQKEARLNWLYSSSS